MNDEARIHLLARVARSASVPETSVYPSRALSILSLIAPSYGSRPTEDATVPTGFDPVAVALFESIVEAAYLVASADGVFDNREQVIFESIVVEACRGAVEPEQIADLVSELADQLRREGMDRRIEVIARAVTKKEHAREVLRIAAVLAHASDDVSPSERDVLGQLARNCGLAPTEVDAVLTEVKSALAGAAGP